MTELKPCPHCGGESYLHTEDVFFVECWKCRFSGPDSCTEEDAVESWNALPRPLRWTKETPTDPGWYWFRNLSKPQIVYLHSVKNRKPHPADEWAGPIQEPIG